MGKRAVKPDDGLEFDYSRLRARRLMLEFPQRKLSRLIGAHANAVLEWEKGRGEGPSLEQMVRAGRILGTPLGDLFDVWDRVGRNAKPRKARE
jgi:transcriptional regulator with XRE-family HTH domain